MGEVLYSSKMIGKVVHYVDHDHICNWDGTFTNRLQCLAAIVNNVSLIEGQEWLGLTVLTPSATADARFGVGYPTTCDRYSSIPASMTWHWPESCGDCFDTKRLLGEE